MSSWRGSTEDTWHEYLRVLGVLRGQNRVTHVTTHKVTHNKVWHHLANRRSEVLTHCISQLQELGGWNQRHWLEMSRLLISDIRLSTRSLPPVIWEGMQKGLNHRGPKDLESHLFFNVFKCKGLILKHPISWTQSEVDRWHKVGCRIMCALCIKPMVEWRSC